MNGAYLSPDERIRVLVAEASPMTGQLIAGALKRGRQQFDVVASTSSSTETIRRLEAHPADVAVISSELQDGPLTGFKVLHQLRASRSKTAAIMLLDSGERDLVIDAFRGGARGIFCRMQSFKALPKCIRSVHKGQIWAGNTEIEFLLEALTHFTPLQLVKSSGMKLLTAREEEVVRLVAEGMRNRDIALKLNVSEHTVRNYLFRVFDKLGVSSRVELVLYALSRRDPALLDPQ
ncbi:MAG: response regulator transcription factor [Acidobacteria bacterium]|nr:response regulator transcription factor [Acidobacteriota bacterium]